MVLLAAGCARDASDEPAVALNAAVHAPGLHVFDAPAGSSFVARGAEGFALQPEEGGPHQSTSVRRVEFETGIDRQGRVRFKRDDSPFAVSIELTSAPWELDEGRVEAGAVVFSSRRGDGAVALSARREGLKEDIVLPKALANELQFQWRLHLDERCSARLEADGSIGIYGPAGPLFDDVQTGDEKSRSLLEQARRNAKADTQLYRLPAPVVVDARGGAHSIARFSLEGDRIRLTATSLQQLAYPISIDPTILVSTSGGFELGGTLESGVDTASSALNRAVVKRGVGAWSAAVTFANARRDHETVAYNGYLYVLGGYNGVSQFNDVQYSKINANGSLSCPVSCGANVFQATSSFTTGRSVFGAVAANGYLYVVGGSDGTATPRSDVQFAKFNSDGTLGTFASTTSLSSGRSYHKLLTNNGYLYVVGGSDGVAVRGEVFYAPLKGDGTIGAWTQNATTTLVTHSAHGAAVYNDRLYVVAGDSGGAPITNAEYAPINSDGSVGTFVATTALPAGVTSTRAVASNGFMYVFGGATSTAPTVRTANVYVAPIYASGALGPWETTTSLVSTTWKEGAVIYNGYAYYTGGDIGGYSANNYYAPLDQAGVLSAASTTTAIPTGRRGHCTVLANGRLYITGGFISGGTYSNDILRGTINPADGTVTAWASETNRFTTGRAYHGCAVMNDYIYVVAGDNAGVYRGDIQLAQIDPNPANNGALLAWASGGPALATVRQHPGVIAVGNYLYVLGGKTTGGTLLTDTLKGQVNPLTGAVASWVATADFDTAGRTAFGIVAYRNYMYVLGGQTTLPGWGGTDTIRYGAIQTNGDVTGWATNPTVLPEALSDFGVVTSGGEVYVLGGYNGTASVSAVRSAPFNSNGSIGTWSTEASLTAARGITTSATAGGYIYTAAGCATWCSDYGTSVDVMKIKGAGGYGSTPATNATWNLPSARFFPVVAGYNGYLYSLGGCITVNTCSASFPASNAINSTLSWRVNTDGTLNAPVAQTALPVTVGAADGFAYNGFAYVLGGFLGNATAGLSAAVYRAPLNATTGAIGAWVTGAGNGLPDLPFARFNHRVTVWNGYVYVVGGCKGGDPGGCSPAANAMTDVIKSQIQANGDLGAWSSAGTLPTAMVGGGAVAYNGRLYAIGGQTGTGSPSRTSAVYVGAIDPSTHNIASFAQTTPIFKARAFFVSGAANGYLYAVGGWQGAQEMEDWEAAEILPDGSLGQWFRAAAWATGKDRDSAGGTVYNGALYTIGGNSGAYSPEVWVSNLQTPKAQGSYSRLFDVGSTAISFDTLTLTGTANQNGTARLTYATAPASGVFSAPIDKGIVPLNSAITLSGASQRYLWVRVGLDDSSTADRSTGLGTPLTLSDMSFAYTGVGPPTKLAFSVQPSSAQAGVAIAPAIQVAVQDASGNTVTSSSASITLAIGTNPGGSTLSGTATVSAVNGIATFSNLSLDKVGTGYTLSASSAGLTGATSSTFNITPGLATKLAITVQPTNALAGSVISPAVQVTVQDAFNNTVTSSSASIAMAIGTNPGGSTLSGTTPVSAVSGVATFSNLSLNKVGTGYTLSASSAGLTSATSSTFNITPGAATKLAFTVQPSSATAGGAIAPAIQVTVQDANNNTVTSSSASIAMAIGTNPGGSTLSGTTPVSAVSGVATFSNLSLNKVGTGYTLAASSAGLTGATSSTFNITAGAATKLGFTVQPSNAQAGNSIAPAIQVTVLDANDNTVTSSSASIAMAIGTNPGASTLSGTTPVSAVSGVATFSNLSLNKVGTGYTLSASSAGLTSATSSAFNITPGAATKLAFTVQPTNATATSFIAPAVQVTVQDANNNTVTGSSASISMAIGTNPGGSTLSGTTPVSAVSGVATFSNLSLDKVGTGYTLSASSAGLTSATSASFNISVGAATQLAFSAQPSNAQAGVSIAPAIVVTVQDAGGNTVTSSSASIAIAIGTNPGASTLSGTTPVSAVSGVATFNNLSLNKVGNGYTLAASSAGLTGATSATFNITPGAATKLAFTVQPSSALAGASIAPAIQVTVQDANNNTVTSSSASISMAIGVNPGSSTLSGTTPVSAVSGVATFSNLSLNKVGTGYTLSASSAGLTSATSTTFNISAGAATQLAFTVQPTTAQAAANIAPAVQVTVQDANGNTVTGSSASIAMAIGLNPGASTLSGTTPVSAVSGVATFSNLSLNKVGTGYTLTASSAGLTGATSATFNITPGAATKLAFTVQPSNATAGGAIAPAIQVTVQDANNNTVTGSSASIAMVIGTNPGGSTLSGTTPVSAVSGVATFSNLSLNKVGTGYTLSASSAGLTSATSATFNITAGAATQLAFTVQPSTAAAGASIAPAVQVTVQDANGNTVTGSSASIAMAIGTNPGASTLSGTTPVSAVSGVATFSNLSLNKVGTGYTLSASSAGLASATSATFNITPGAATKLAFTVQPSSAQSGTAIAPAIQVTVQDANNNTVTSSSASITMAIGLNPGGSTLSGTTPVSAVSGVATFSNLSLDKVGTGYTLSASSAGLTSATSSTFNITAGAATKLAFTVQPASAISGAAIAPAIQVTVQDANGNTVTSSIASIAMAIGTNPGGSTLSGTTPVSAVSGVATFSNLSLDKAGTGYTLSASSAGLTSATSTTFNITAGAATKLAFTVQPASALAGASIAPAIQVTVQDANNNTVTSSSASISMAIGLNPGGSTLSGTTPVSAVSGVATFSNLSLDKVGTGYTLTASSAGLTSATSGTFNISPGAATKLAFTVQPSSAASGASIAPAVQVTVQDANNNTVTSSSASISMAIGLNPGGSTLSGTTPVSAVSGVATFSNLALDKAGTGYTLSASSAGLTSATSAAFNITAGAATKLAFTVQPSSALAGASIAPAIVVTVQDANSNTVTGSSASITMAIGSNPGGSTLSGTTPVSAVSGLATFSNLSLDKVGSGYTLTASSAGLTGATSSAFNISAGAATKLAFTVQPSGAVAGVNLAPAVQVTVQDAFNNTVTGSSASIAMAIGVNPGGSTLSGTTPVSAISGVATFSNLSLDKSGTGYTLSATSAGLTSATSSTFNITAGTATKLAFTVQPTATSAGSTLSPAVQVTVQDANNNTVTSSSASIAIAIGTNPGGSVLSGTTPVSAVNGVATFSNLSLDKAGTGYTLSASSAGLTGATSATFNITAGAANKLAFFVQPANAAAGVPVASIQVEVQDGIGNRVTSSTASITLSIGNNPGSSTLSGTNPVSAVSGLATFSNISLDKVGTGYTLIASAVSMTNAVSTAFNITPGTATKLAFTVQPSSAVAGASIAPAVQVTVQDAFNNTVTSSSASIAMAIGTNPGSSTLSGTTPVSAVSGVATFSNLSLNKVGTGYTLSATSAGLAGATSTTFNISAGAANRLAFTVQPTSTTSGANLAPAVQVTVQDSNGNTVTGSSASVAMAIGTNPGASTLSGTTPVSAISGVATFSNLSLDKVGSGYTLTASSAGLTSATSSAFNISAGAATKLAFSVQPSTAAAGASIAPAIQVTVQDANSNTVTGSSASISIAIGTNPGASTLSGTTPVSAVSGVATFSNLSLNKTGTGYTLSASSAGLTSATSATFNITAGAATKLAFTVQPTNALSGASIAPAIQVTVQDANNNTVTGSSASISMAIGSNPGSSTLSGTTPVSAVSGVATFSNLSLDKVGTGYTLSASSAGLTSATSTTFNITPGAAAKLAITVQPSTAQAGANIAPAVQVTVQDANNNTVTSSSASISMAIGLNPGASTLSGTTPVSAVSGVANFGNLSLNKVGVGYTLTASSAGLTSATSAAFNITPSAATKLAFTVQPSTAAAGASIAPAVQVTVQDAFDNTVTSSSASIAMAIGLNPGGSVLSGTTPVSAINGVATFSNLSLDKVGAGYTLAASSAGLTGATSSAFNVGAGGATKVVFTVQPSSAVAGVGIAPSIQVTVQDASNNVVSSSSASITLAIGTNPGGSTLSGLTTVSAVNGVATFSGLSLNRSGIGYTLTAASAGLSGATSATFDITAAAAAKLAFTVQPTNAASGASLTPAVQVTVQDAFNNTVTSSGASIAMAIGTNPGASVLSGTSPVSAINGVATFTNLSLDKAGVGYTLSATSAGLTSATSSAFNISAGAAARLAFVVQPSSATAGAAIAPAFTVAVQDGAGNTVFSSSAAVTLGIGANPGGSTLSGTTSAAAASGVATFGAVSLDKAGTGYTLTASSPGLTGATSSVFNITFGGAAKLVFSVQPSNATAGAGIAPAIQVTVQDANGNSVTSSTASISLAIGLNPGGSTLTGLNPVTAVGGVATFTGLSLDKAGTGYTLTASSAGLTGATSTSFNVTAAAANRLAFSVQPSSAAAGVAIAPAIAVTVQDAFGNTVSGSSASVSLALGNNPGGSTLSGTTSVNATSGVATFSGLSLDKSGTGYTLAASSAGLTGATSSTFNITAGAANRLAFSVQPSDVAANASIAPAVRVAVQDANGNTVTSSSASITVALGANPGGSALSGTLTVAASSGVATFSTLALDKAGVGYTLTATGASLTGATSGTFTVTSGTANRLAFVVQPSNAVAGAAIAPAIQVAVQDSSNNTVSSSSATVTLAIAANPGSSTLSGTVSAAAVNGIATFANVSLDKVAAGYTLSATSTGLTSATSSTFTITAASAAALAFSVQPVNGAAGAFLVPAVQVQVRDAFGNLVPGSSAPVTLSISSNPGGATLSGGAATAASGIASFGNVSLDKAGVGYRLTAASPGLTSAISNAFTVSAGAPAAVAFVVQPSDATAGTPISPAMQVAVLDANGNTVTTSSAAVSLAIGNNPGGAALSGTSSGNATSGLVSFGTVALDKSGTSYTLVASSPGLTSATSSVFTITAGGAVRLAFAVAPSAAPAGQAMSPAVEVEVQDALGNRVLGATDAISLAIGTNPSAGVLSGGAAQTAAAGKATFSAVAISKPGTAYTLTASAPGLTTATSPSFDILPGTPTKLAFITPPRSVSAGACSGLITVQTQDAAGNPSSLSLALPVSLSTSSSVGGFFSDPACMTPITQVTIASGMSADSFYYSDTKAGAALMTAAAVAFIAGTQNITVAGASTAGLDVRGFPSPVMAGQMGTVAVTALDTFGNAATDYVGPIALTSSDIQGQMPSGAAFALGDNGQKMLSASLRTAGTHSITASSGPFSGTQSNIVVEPLSATSFAVTGIPSPLLVGETADVTVEAHDAYGNLVPSYRGTVQFTSSDGFAHLPKGTTLGAAEQGRLTLNKKVTFFTGGTHSVTVTDANGLTGQQTGIVVRDDAAPVIQHDANDRAAVNVPYVYNALKRINALGAQPMTYSVCGGQAGFTVDAVTGSVQWLPQSAGAVSFCVQAQNAAGVDQYVFIVTVVNRAATQVTASFTATPDRGQSPLDVELDASASTADPSALPMMYRWEFGDGAPPAVGVQQSHRFVMPGRYLTRLTVYDAFGGEGTAQVPVTVLGVNGELPPTAKIIASATTGTDSLDVSFTCDCQPGSAPIATTWWDFGNGQTSTSQSPQMTFAPGRSVVRLTVVDANGLTAADAVEIEVTRGSQHPPTCRAAADPSFGPVPLNVRWVAGAGAGSAPVTTVKWDFGSGEVLDGPVVKKTYTTAGYYQGVLVVTDESGLSCRDALTVVATTAEGLVPPRIVGTPNTAVECSQAYRLSAEGLPAVQGTGPVTWSLDGAPDGMSIDTSTGEISWVPRPWQSGAHKVTLVATTAAGSDRISFEVMVSCGEGSRLGVGCACDAASAPAWLLAAAVALLWRGKRRGARLSAPL